MTGKSRSWLWLALAVVWAFVLDEPGAAMGCGVLAWLEAEKASTEAGS